MVKVSLFYEVLHMSMVASIVIIITLCCRRLLKKAPKIFCYALWGVVLFRLLCPVSIQLPVSFVPDWVTGNAALEPKTVVHNEKMMETEEQGNLEKSSAVHSADEGTESVVESGNKESSDQKTTIYAVLLSVLPDVWLAGMGIMFIYSVISLMGLKKKLVGSVPYHAKEKIYLSDYIGTPFVIGLIKPKIYLPSKLSDKEIEYVLLHEKHHIYRKDYLVKMLAYVALILHWFNPFVWIAFVLSGKDMEMSCDEAVMKKMGGEIGQEYSSLLLRLATGKAKISPMPLAFGEGDTKERIVNVLKWKKTTKWGMFLATVLCVVVVVGCAVNWEKKEVAKGETYKKHEIVDVAKETYFEQGYYRRSDGKWATEVLADESGTKKTMVYQYRLVLHGRMPNAAMDSTFVILSNRKNITFEQAWKASGLSSNSNDYFNPEDAVLVSRSGDLESLYKENDKYTLYYKGSATTVEPKKTDEASDGLQEAIDKFGINMVFPENATCKDPKLVQVNDKFLEISYWDSVSDANCTLTIRKDGKEVKTDYAFDDSLTIMWGMMGEIEVKSTADHKVVCASWVENGYAFSICAISAGEEKNEIDPSTIGKEASYMIKAFQ